MPAILLERDKIVSASEAATVVASPSVMAPDAVTVPLPDATKAPAPLTPVPLRVNASAILIPAVACSVAPDSTTVPPAVVPRAALLSTTKVPAETVVVPVYALLPVKVKTPTPAFVKSPGPETTPDKVAATPVPTLTTPPLNDKEMALSILAPSPVTDKVPEFNVSAPEPRFESPLMDKPPANTSVAPA